MRRIFCFAIVATAIFLVGAFNVLAQEQAAKPTFKEGDSW